MNVIDAIRSRRSIRAYLPKPVEEAKLQAVLEAGRLAPSAGNRQDWRYVVVQDAALRSKLAEAANNQKFVGEAPVVIVGCAKTDGYQMSCGEKCYPIDIAISMDHMTLKAVEEGLGTCWIGAFNQPAIKKLLNIPEDIRVVELMPIGYPAEQPPPRTRLPQKEIVMLDTWK